MEPKVAVITGITGSVGKGIFLRLIEEFKFIKIYGTARSSKRASDAFILFTEQINSLLPRIKNGEINLIPSELDTVDIEKIRRFNRILHQENKSIDFLFLNAGAIISDGLDWPSAAIQFFTDIRGFPIKPKYIKHDGKSCTPENISLSFFTNVYGHYILAELLQDILASSSDSRIVWVGSLEGEERFFDVSDIEGRESINPYGSNKFCIQVISRSLNRRYKKLGLPISSIVAAPGIIPSNIAASMIPSFFVYFLAPLFWILRFFLNIKELTINSYCSAEAIIYAVITPVDCLETDKRADSVCSRLGVPSTCLASLPCLTDEMVSKTDDYLIKLKKKFEF